jgi:hypothetical protein
VNALAAIRDLIQSPSTQIDTTAFVVALVVSTVSGLLVSILYQLFYENRATGSQIHRSFLLIAPATTALFVAIQYSLPLSLGLVGALTIIRFRTPIKEPEEVGFLMVVIASSIVCATYRFILLGVLLGLVLLVLLLQRYLPRLFRRSARSEGVLLITLGADVTDDQRASVVDALARRLPGGRVQSISFGNGIATIHYSFSRSQANDLTSVKDDLDTVAPIEKVSIFYNRAGLL